MAYPEPVPRLSRREFQEFQRKLEEFKLTDSQIEFYVEAKKRFGQDMK